MRSHSIPDASARELYQLHSSSINVYEANRNTWL
jgi:hypothetical protein